MSDSILARCPGGRVLHWWDRLPYRGPSRPRDFRQSVALCHRPEWTWAYTLEPAAPDDTRPVCRRCAQLHVQVEP